MRSWTPEQRKACQEGRLDQRCRSCGATSAASSWCCTCGSRDLEYRTHVAGQTQWCQQLSGAAVHVPVNPRGPRQRKQEPTAAVVPAAVPSPDMPEGTLWGSTE